MYVFLCGLGLGLKWTGENGILASFYTYRNYRGQTFLYIIYSSYPTFIISYNNIRLTNKKIEEKVEKTTKKVYKGEERGRWMLGDFLYTFM